MVKGKQPYAVTEIKKDQYTVEPVYYGFLGTNRKCLDYEGVLI